MRFLCQKTFALIARTAATPSMLAEVENYAPTAKAFQRAYRMRLIVDVPRQKVAEEIVKAVRKGRRHVRLPKRAAAFAMLTEMPRRATELLLTGVPHRVK